MYHSRFNKLSILLYSSSGKKHVPQKFILFYCTAVLLSPERMDLRRVDFTVYSYNTYYFQHISSLIVDHWVHPRSFLLPPWIELLPPWFLYIQDYKRTCDLINIYKLYKVNARESSLRCYSLRVRVELEGRVVSGSDWIPLQYVFKDLVNV